MSDMSMPRLLELYRKEVAPALQKKFAYSSVMQVPHLEKITLNMGVGEAALELGRQPEVALKLDHRRAGLSVVVQRVALPLSLSIKPPF